MLKRHSLKSNKTNKTSILCTHFSLFGVLAQPSECSAPRPSNRWELHHQRRPLRVLWCLSRRAKNLVAKSKHVDEKTIVLGMLFKYDPFVYIYIYIYSTIHVCMFLLILIYIFVTDRYIFKFVLVCLHAGKHPLQKAPMTDDCKTESIPIPHRTILLPCVAIV